MRSPRSSLAIASLLGLMVALIACRGQFGGFLEVAGPTKATPTPTATPTPSPTATPTPPPSPTPNPCDVKRVDASASAFVALGETFRLDVTPVGPAGPQEGELDRCNYLRTVQIESATAGVHCIASCSGFVQTWKADARGEAQIRVSVERVISAPVTVTVR